MRSRLAPEPKPDGSTSRILWPLATAFGWGVAARAKAYRRGWLETRRLNRPVVSVGNLTVGGTGKTPLVTWIAESFLRHGYRPCILTRGYGRRGMQPVAIDPAPQRSADPRRVGDEPALLASKLPHVPIVIGADRYRGGLMAERRFGIDVHVLDDGFQHWALARDLDVVLLDATQPLSDRALLPAGRQREPSTALARAHAVVLTRTELADSGSLAERVRRVTTQAQLVHARTVLTGLIDLASNATFPPDAFRGEKIFAFCGIGNPRAFFADLERWGLRVMGSASFRDHHVYTPREVSLLVASAREAGVLTLMTTEKDSYNLPELDARQGIRIVICSAKADVREHAAFEEALLKSVAQP